MIVIDLNSSDLIFPVGTLIYASVRRISIAYKENEKFIQKKRYMKVTLFLLSPIQDDVGN